MRPGTGRRLGKDDHAALIRWAVECAEHVLPFFVAACPADLRPRAALDAGLRWAAGEIGMTVLRSAALAAHAAARAAEVPAAEAAARASGHAAGVAQVPGHARRAAESALKAATAAGGPDAGAIERAWQFRRLPANLRSVATLSSQNARARNA